MVNALNLPKNVVFFTFNEQDKVGREAMMPYIREIQMHY